MDPLSDVLSLLKPQSYKSGGFELGADLALRFPKHQGIKCYAVVSGQCWLTVQGVADPIRLTAGDCYLLPRGLPFSLATDLAITPIDFSAYLASLSTVGNGHATPPNGSGCFIVGGHFILSGDHADILLGILPPVVPIQNESDRAAMRWSIDRMMQELRDPQPGGTLIAQQLAYMMIVQALRLHLAEGARGRVGWLFALADQQMSAAIAAMHSSPGHRWSLQELAEHVGMSRSIFAQRFKATVGDSPMEYLTRWRMLLAADRLANSADSLTTIARSLGYESESAFSTAFKRLMGCSPRQHTRNSATPSTREEESTQTRQLESVGL
jgi:AraC-like DNA-binding protein